MKTLYLCAAGNPEGVRLALNVNAAQQRWDRIVLLDDAPDKQGKEILGVPIVGPFSRLEEADPAQDEVVNMVARTTARRMSAGKHIARSGLPFASLVDPQVDVLGVELGRGVTVYRHATLAACCSVGDGSVVLPAGIVGHGAQLGPGCVVAPGGVINARVKLGEGVYVGTNASILPDLVIGPWVTIGGNSSVVQDVPAGATVMGVPGEILLPVEARPSVPAPARANGASHEIERSIIEVWCALLDLEEVGAEQNFFDIGGTSLLALTMRNRLIQSTGCTLSPTDIYRFPTARALAAHLGDSTTTRPPAAQGQTRAQLRRQRRMRS